MTPTPTERVSDELLPCPFCGCEMNIALHSAFHRTDSTKPASCWLATAGEFGGPYELDEVDYSAWNRRSSPPSDRGAVIEEVLSAARRIVEQRWNPVNYDLFCDDATIVARALLSTPPKDSGNG